MRQLIFPVVLLVVVAFLVQQQYKLSKISHSKDLQIESLINQKVTLRGIRVIYKDVVKYVPTEGSVKVIKVIEEGKEKEVVEYKTAGFTHKLGLVIIPLRVGIGADIKFGYFNRWGAEVGIVYYNSHLDIFPVSPEVGVSYKLENGWISNTELFIGYDVLRINPLIFGLRINL